MGGTEPSVQCLFWAPGPEIEVVDVVVGVERTSPDEISWREERGEKNSG